jgi:hypothetical protein
LLPVRGLLSFLLELTVLGAPDFIDRFVEMLGDMEAVMNNLCVRHLGFGRCFKRRAHVHNDNFHLLTFFERYALSAYDLLISTYVPANPEVSFRLSPE